METCVTCACHTQERRETSYEVSFSARKKESRPGSGQCMFAIFLVYFSFVTLAATVVIAEPGRNDMSGAQTHAYSWHGH